MTLDDEEKIHFGSVAPDFTLPDQSGKSHTLSNYRGQWVFLYFYPKDETQTCTIEACAIRDHYDDFQRCNVKILGISADSVENHERFAKKCEFPFTLLSDAHKKVIHQYRAFTAHFDSSEEIEQMSFLIDVMGRIEKIYHNVKPSTHAEEVLRDLAAIKKEGEE